MVSSAEPSAAVRDAAVLEHISRNNGRRIQSLQALNAKATQSQEAAKKKLAEVKKELDDLRASAPASRSCSPSTSPR